MAATPFSQRPRGDVLVLFDGAFLIDTDQGSCKLQHMKLVTINPTWEKADLCLALLLEQSMELSLLLEGSVGVPI